MEGKTPLTLEELEQVTGGICGPVTEGEKAKVGQYTPVLDAPKARDSGKRLNVGTIVELTGKTGQNSHFGKMYKISSPSSGWVPGKYLTPYSG